MRRTTFLSHPPSLFSPKSLILLLGALFGALFLLGGVLILFETEQSSGEATVVLKALFLFLGITGIMVFLGFLLSLRQNISLPLRLLNQRMHSLWTGTLPTSFRFRVSGEVGSLISGFNHMVEELNRREKTAFFVSEVSQLFTSSLELKEALQRIPHIAQKVLGDSCILFLLNNEGNALIPFVTAEPKQKKLFPLSTPLPLTQSAVGKAVLSRKPVLISDTSQPHEVIGHYRDIHGVLSYLAVPLSSREQIWGGLALAVLEGKRRFGERDMWMISILADRIAAAIENERLSYELQTAEARYRSVFDHAGDTVITTTPEGIIQSWNQSASQMFGYHPEEVLDQAICCLIPPKYLEKMEAWQRAALRGEAIYDVETTQIRKDGTTVQVSLTLSPIREKEGKEIVGLSYIEKDITERKCLEQAMLAEKEFSTCLVKHVTDGIMVSNSDGRVPVYNRRMEEISGYTWEETNRKGWSTLVQPTLVPLEEARTEGEHAFAREGLLDQRWIIRRKDGKRCPIVVSTFSLRNSVGEPLTLYVVRDFPERK